MISVEALKKYYPFEPPIYFYELAEKYEHEDKKLVSDEEFEAVAVATGMPKECFDVLREANEKLFADKDRNAAALYLRAVLTVLRNPWENRIYSSPLFTIPDIPDGTVALLFVTAALGYTLTVRKPPEDLNEENINAYRGYTKNFTDKNGYWGIGEVNWNLLCAGGCMFLFNSLKFQPESFASDFLVLTDGKEYKTIIKGGFKVAADGTLTANDEKTVFTTSFSETESEFTAHEVLPNAAVSNETAVFDKKTWSVALCEKDMVLGFHIPSNKPYTVEEHRRSMAEAAEFYKKFYPATDFKAFVCYSWLYSAQNKFIFDAESRILEIQKHVHLCPMVSELDETLGFIRKGSSLQQRLADYRAAGNAYHVGYMYVPNDEAKNFGDFTHEL